VIDDGGAPRIADFGLSFLDWKSSSSIETRTRIMAGAFALSYIGGSFAADAINPADTRSGAGSPRWMAPELLVPEAHNKTSARPTFESDVFSFAMLIYEVIRSYLIPTTAHYFNKDLQWLGAIPR
jgi:serine/threonine protein kinase